MGRDVTKSVGYIVWYMLFCHVVSQEEQIVGKVILLPCTKLFEGKLLVCDFLKNLGKWS